MKRNLVSAELIRLAALKADEIMAREPATREAWLDQVRTSQAAKLNGGTLLFVSDNDWVPAFFVWYHGGGAALPRERHAERKPNA